MTCLYQLYDNDHARVAPLIAYVGAQLREAESICGSAALQNYLNTADPTVLKQVQDALASG